MSPRSSSAAILPLSWADVLDRVSITLGNAEAEALKAEQAQLAPVPGQTGSDDTASACLERLETRLRAMQDCLARAEQAAAESETAAGRAGEAFVSWIAHAETARQQLAKAAAEAI